MESTDLKTDVSCSNPECSYRITITVDQKIDRSTAPEVNTVVSWSAQVV